MQLIESNGIHLHYTEAGPPGAPALVLINSLGTDLRLWQGVVPVLSRRFRVICYDKRGHGLSDVTPAPYRLQDHTDDLLGLLDALGIGRAMVCGLSVGGMVALQFTAQHPGRVAALILADTAPRIGSEALWNQRIQAVRDSGLEGMADAILERWFSAEFLRDQPLPAAGWRALLARGPAEGYIGTCAALRDADLTDAAAKVRAPTLCLCGSADAVTPPAQMQTLAAGISGARFALIDGAGHLPPAENPAVFAQLVADFCNICSGAVDIYSAGMTVRRQVLGEAYVERATRAATPLDADFQQYIAETAWGRVWSRGGLSLRDRSLLTIALLTALNHHAELAMHVRATRSTGATPEEVREALLHTAVYAGVPGANHAFKIAREIFFPAQEGDAP